MSKRHQYVPGSVPEAGNPVLEAWLRRELQALYQGFQAAWDMPISTVPPARAYDGMLRYADGVNWNPGAGRGVYEYVGGVWVKL